MRIDAFSDDEEFDLLLSQTGMNQLALGVEGPSQRLRNKLMKGISEEDILNGFDFWSEDVYSWRLLNVFQYKIKDSFNKTEFNEKINAYDLDEAKEELEKIYNEDFYEFEFL